MRTINLGTILVGGGGACYIVAELGQNHSGNLATALKMVRAAKKAGATAIKLQTRHESMICVPKVQCDALRDTPWGPLSYVDYRRRLELGSAAYAAIDQECRQLGLAWSSSVWDEPSLEFLLKFEPPWIKIPSACLTDIPLLEACRQSGTPIVASTGMSTEAQISRAVSVLGPDRLVLLHCTSTYPAPTEELNLSVIEWLRERFLVPIGYSGHHPGVWDGLCAAVLGACVVEKHFTLDRSSWGTDQAASLEPSGFARMTRYIRQWEAAKGDGLKRVYDSERPVLARLRRVP